MSVDISVSDAFDGGNGKLVKIVQDESLTEVHIEIQPDVYTELEDIQHMQYFSFRVIVKCSKPVNIKYVLCNASKVSYPEAWRGSTVMYNDTNRTDTNAWKRKVDTFYTQGQLNWEHLHTKSSVTYFSYFVPFTYEHHMELIDTCCGSPHAKVMSLGQTLDGRELECITIGTGDTIAWIIHRQHPGETMAEFYAEGLLYKLLGIESDIDEDTKKALSLYTFYIVPNMCPDGAIRGHLRTNGVGSNLNREWTTKGTYTAPTLERSPEVYHVLNKMKETSVDIFLDIHGDEELPFNFISGAEKVPNWSQRLESLHGAFVSQYSLATSDMQAKVGYPPADNAERVLQYLNVASNQVCYQFDCLAMTLEMPFKDCLSNPDPLYGWNPARARALGANVIAPLLYVHAFLRNKEEFWTTLPAEDAYVAPTNEYDTPETDDDDGFKPLQKRFYSDVHEGHQHGRIAK